MPQHEVAVVVDEAIVRRALRATGEAVRGERIEHRLTMCPAGSKYTLKFQTFAVRQDGTERKVDTELFLTAVFQMKGTRNENRLY